MKHRLLSASLAVLFTLSTSGIAAATSANISPHSQTRAHGQNSSWTATWGDTGPYDYVFHPDVANPGLHEAAEYGVSKTSYYHSMAFYPCTTTTFTQELSIKDAYGAAYHQSTAREAGGHCGPVLP